jgi:hypothetical protein
VSIWWRSSYVLYSRCHRRADLLPADASLNIGISVMVTLLRTVRVDISLGFVLRHRVPDDDVRDTRVVAGSPLHPAVALEGRAS